MGAAGRRVGLRIYGIDMRYWGSVLAPGSFCEALPMKKVLAIVAIVFALVVGTTAVVSFSSQQAYACEGDHKGS